MIQPVGPCSPRSDATEIILQALNVVQVLLLAFLAQRAVRKDTKERSGSQ